MKPKMIFVLVACLMLLTAPLASATIWDVQNDFSGTTNPAGAWSYGWETAPGGTFHLYDTVSSFLVPGPGWYDSGVGSLPIVWKNTSGSSALGAAPGEVSLHPGPAGQYSVVRWTSPVTGAISIDGTFGAGDQGWMSYFIYDGTTSIFEVHHNIDQVNQSDSFGLTRSVSIGSTIDFMVGENYFFGNTPLSATINDAAPVPIPGALILFGSGLLGLVGIGRRRRKKS